jgi:hypothetical protein
LSYFFALFVWVQFEVSTFGLDDSNSQLDSDAEEETDLEDFDVVDVTYPDPDLKNDQLKIILIEKKTRKIKENLIILFFIIFISICSCLYLLSIMSIVLSSILWDFIRGRYKLLR